MFYERVFKILSEERLSWLEEAHEFVKIVISEKYIKNWKTFIKKEESWKEESK